MPSRFAIPISLPRHLASLLSINRLSSASATPPPPPLSPLSAVCPPARLHRLLSRAEDPVAARELVDHYASLDPSILSTPSFLSLFRSSPNLLHPSSLTLLLRSACRVSRNLPLAISLFRRCISHGLEPEVASYHVLAQALCRRGQVNSAAGLLDDMRNRGLVPDPLTYATILNSLCHRKRLREARRMLFRMGARGCTPDTLHFNTVITGFCREGRAQGAREVFDEMPENGCTPDLITYTVLVNGLTAEGMLDDAKAYLEEMMGKGFVPHFSVFHGLVRGLCTVGRGKEASSIVGEMMEIGVLPHLETWEIVVQLVCDGEEDGLVAGVVDKVALTEDEWKKSARIVDVGYVLEEYMVEKFEARRRTSGR